MPIFLDPDANEERKINRKLELLSRLMESEAQPTEKIAADFNAARVQLAQLHYEQGNYRNALNALGDIDEPALREKIAKKLE